MSKLPMLKRFVGVATSVAVVLTPLNVLALANPTPDQHWPAPVSDSGENVRAIVAASDGSYYVAGSFNDFGTSYGNAVLADATTGLAKNSFPDVDGDVYVTISDGNDGWYIGGKFNRVGTLQRTGVAHIFPSGVADGAFNANVVFADSSNAVYALVTDGTKLFVGGDFGFLLSDTTFGGTAANGIMGLNAASGAVLGGGFTPPDIEKTGGPGGQEVVYALAMDTAATVVFAGGDFNDVDGNTLNNIAAFNTTTGAVNTSFNPDVNGIVYALAWDNAIANLYAGGSFTSVDINGTPATRNHLAGFSLVGGGSAISFDPDVDGDVYALALDATDGVLYFGGSFTDSNVTPPRNNLTAVDKTTAADSGFDPNVDGDVYSIALTPNGDTLYAVGPFTTVNGGTSRPGAAAFDTGTSTETGFAQDTQLDTYFVSLNDNDDAVLIGTYDGNPAPPVQRQYRADDTVFVDPFGQQMVLHILANGTVDPAFTVIGPGGPYTDGDILALALSPDEQTLYIGGSFGCVGLFLSCTSRSNLAAIDADDATLLPFDPDVDGPVRALAVSSDGATLYAGGDFGTVNGGTTRSRLAAFATVDSDARAFDPGISGAGNSVYALALTSDGSTLYIGGDFTAFFGPTFRNNLAAATTAGAGAAVTTFDPDMNDTVRALALSGDDGTLYAGGSFDDVNGGMTRNYAAAFDTTTGVATGFDPDAGNTVFALATGPDGIVYLGGVFDTIQGADHNYIAAVDPDTGADAGFDANLEGVTESVFALAHGGTGNGLLAGGKFNQAFQDAGGAEIPYVVTTDLAHYTDSATPTPTPATPTPTPGGGSHSSGGGGGFLPGVSPTPTPTLTPLPSGVPPRGDPLNLARYGLHEGDVVGAPAAGDPDVYIVNEWGYKRLFLNPIIFSFYGHLGFSRVHDILPPGRDAFPVSGLFRNCEANDPKVYAVEVTGEDTGFLHHVNISGDVAVSQDPDFFRKVFCINNREFNWYPKSPTPYTSLSQIPPYHRP